MKHVMTHKIISGTLLFYSFCEEPLVSIDFNGNPYSSIVDGPSTKVIGKKMVKILSWYDNEWGFSNRMMELMLYLFK